MLSRFFFYWHGAHPDLPSFPTRRSSDLSAWSPRCPRSSRGPVTPASSATSCTPRGTTRRDRKRHTSELQSPMYLVCRLLLEKKKNNINTHAIKPGTTGRKPYAHEQCLIR